MWTDTEDEFQFNNIPYFAINMKYIFFLFFLFVFILSNNSSIRADDTFFEDFEISEEIDLDYNNNIDLSIVDSLLEIRNSSPVTP